MLNFLEFSFLFFQHIGGTTRDCLGKSELKTPSSSCAAIPTRKKYLALPRCMVIIGPMPAGTSGLRSVSSAGLDPSDALGLWLDIFPPAAVSGVAPTLVSAAPSSRGALPAPPL